MDIGLSATDLAVYGLIASFLPGVTAIFNRPHFPGWLKQVIEVVIAVVAGGLAYGLKNGWDFSSRAGVITALLGVWAATQAAYLLFWQHALAPAIESKINGGKAPKHAVSDNKLTGPGPVPVVNVSLPPNDPAMTSETEGTEFDESGVPDDKPLTGPVLRVPQEVDKSGR